MEENRDRPEHEQLPSVNDFFNLNVEFAHDSEVWGVPDYWATPLETLGRGQRDCEDYSVGKYVNLGLLGMPLDRLRITYVRAETGVADEASAQARMVLAYYLEPGAEPLILDNLVGQVLPASESRHLQLLFWFQQPGTLDHRCQDGGQSHGPAFTMARHAPSDEWRKSSLTHA